MDLYTYFESAPGANLTALARKLGCSKSYLSEIAAGKKGAGLRLALKIQEETSGKVTVADLLRPDVPRARRHKESA